MVRAAAVLEPYRFRAVKSERKRVPSEAALQGACHVLASGSNNLKSNCYLALGERV